MNINELKIKRRLVYINSLYVEHRSLNKTGRLINLSGERIRQLLAQGHNLGFFKYENSKKQFILVWSKKISANVLKRELTKSGNLFEIQKKYKVPNKILKKLVKLYDIDKPELINEWRKRRNVKEYKKMVAKMGYSPTSTEMRKDKKFNALWSRIWKAEGCSLSDFRRFHGIDEPKKYKQNKSKD